MHSTADASSSRCSSTSPSPPQQQQKQQPLLANSFGDQFPADVPLLRSCENCRRKKRKCSGSRPSCTRCNTQGEKCVYRPTARFFKPSRHSVDGSAVSRKRPATNIAKQQYRRPRALSAFAAAQDRLKSHEQQQQQQHSLAPADLMLNSSALPQQQGHKTFAASVTSLPNISVAPSSLLPPLADGSLAYMRPGDDSVETQYPSISLSPPHMLSGFVPSPMIAPSPLCDQDYAQLLMANSITHQQQQQQALLAGQRLVSMANVAPPMYSPPLSASSFSTGISATPPLTDCVPSPYTAPYQQLGFWPTPADLVNCNLTAAPLLPMANIPMPTPANAQTPTSYVHEYMSLHPPRSANAEWFA